MTSLSAAGIIFGAAFASFGIGMLIRRSLPEHHLSSDSRDVVKLGMGVIATLSALVLGLLVASSKGNFDTQAGLVNEMATDVVLLDAALARYGPDAAAAREALRTSTQELMDRMWKDPSAVEHLQGYGKNPVETIFDKVAALPAKTETQTASRTRAVELTLELARIRLKLSGRQDNPLEMAFLFVLTIWISVLFAGYGLLAPANATVFIVLIVCAVSMGGAVFLIFELDTPFGGLMQVSKEPLQKALVVMGG